MKYFKMKPEIPEAREINERNDEKELTGKDNKIMTTKSNETRTNVVRETRKIDQVVK